jgi:uncharacterized membrane protein HdeD (DUF308 family)
MEEAMQESVSITMCPMAATCKGMMDKPRSGFALMVPGIVLIILGIAVLIEPRILLWLVAMALFVMGIAMLMLANLMRKFGHRFQDRHA